MADLNVPEADFINWQSDMPIPDYVNLSHCEVRHGKKHFIFIFIYFIFIHFIFIHFIHYFIFLLPGATTETNTKGWLTFKVWN